LVEVAIESGAVLRLAGLLYVLPLLGLVGGAMMGGEGVASLLGGAAGAAVGYWVARTFVRRQRFGAPMAVRVCGHCQEKRT
jgi:sigma-E factor negative regulatory protein RseC